jgi:hypothetical protein
MPEFISIQPNGLYCRFSTIVEDFTHTDMTKEDVIEMYVDRAKKHANVILENGLTPYDEVIKYKEQYDPNY